MFLRSFIPHLLVEILFFLSVLLLCLPPPTFSILSPSATFSSFWLGPTLDLLSKKHVKIVQGLDFLIFPLGNQGQNVDKPKKNTEQIVVN